MIDVCALCWRVPKEKHSNEAMITYQYELIRKQMSLAKATNACLSFWLLNPHYDLQRLRNSDLMIMLLYYTIQIFLFFVLAYCIDIEVHWESAKHGSLPVHESPQWIRSMDELIGSNCTINISWNRVVVDFCGSLILRILDFSGFAGKKFANLDFRLNSWE